jgi:hypothetical protein
VESTYIDGKLVELRAYEDKDDLEIISEDVTEAEFEVID